MYYQLKNIALTKSKNRHNYHVSACIIIGKTRYFGWNSYKTSPRAKRRLYCKTLEKYVFSSCMHAEMHAMLRAVSRHEDLSRAKMKIVRVRKDGEFTMSKPCKHCQKMMRESSMSPKNISYTDWDGSVQNLISWDEDDEKTA